MGKIVRKNEKAENKRDTENTKKHEKAEQNIGFCSAFSCFGLEETEEQKLGVFGAEGRKTQ